MTHAFAGGGTTKREGPDPTRRPPRRLLRAASRAALAGLLLAAASAAMLIPAAPAHAQQATWTTTLTVGTGTGGARGFADGEMGSMSDSAFTVGTRGYGVNRLFAGPHGGFDEDDEWVVFQLFLDAATLPLANPGNYTLVFAGAAFPLSDASEDHTGRSQVFAFTKAWVESNAPSLDGDNYQTTLSDGDAVAVCLRTATQACPGPATGAPAVFGEAYVGRTLGAGPGTIADGDGLTNPGYSYVWTRVDADGESNPSQVGTAATYTLVAADEGKKIKLEASFTDDASNPEKRDVLFPSVGTVDPEPGDDVVWATTMTVGQSGQGGRGYDDDTQDFGSLHDKTLTIRSVNYIVQTLSAGPHSDYDENFEWVYVGLDLPLATIENYTLEFADEEFPFSDSNSNVGVNNSIRRFSKAWTATNAPSLSEANYQATLPEGGTVNVLLRRAANTAATGAPGVAGAAFVGQTLTAGPGTIADANGLTSPGYSYVWTRVDADGESNPSQVGTAGTYTLAAADEGKKIKLEASFTDDLGYGEKRDVLFPSVGTVDATPGSDVLWWATMTVGAHADGARGFDSRTTFGALSDSTFTHSSDDYEVRQLFAGEHPRYAAPSTHWFVFELDGRWQDHDDYRLKLAGETLPLSAAAELSGTGYHDITFTKAWVASNASSLSETNYATTLPVGATVNVLLQETPALPELEFDAATFNVAEDADSVEVKVKLSAAHTAAVTVDYATSDNTAIAGQDYTSRSGTLTFEPGDTEKTFHVPITDDAVYEPTQRFVVTLSNPSNADLGTQGSTAQVVITSDDDVPTATLADVSAGEGDGTMTMTLALSHLSEVATTYQTSTSLLGGTATAGTDYTSFVTGTGLDFTVPAGDMSATLDITLTDDAVPEADETITVSWALSGSDATPATLAFTGTITDNDPIVVGYDPVTYSVDEDDGPVVLTLKVLDPASGGAPREFTVSVSTHNGTASSPVDYGAVTNAELRFSAGDTDKTHSIPINDDTVDEADETFGSAVTVFSGLATVKADADTATVTIVDNDASANNPATGSPAVSGAAYVGETLTAGPGTIDDDDGLTTPG